MRYKAIVSYDGTNYFGWQSQNNTPSIQSELNRALSKVTNSEIKVVGAGRTDGKVHAIGQVFHFDTNKQFKDLKMAINSQLPSDIYVKSCEKVNDDFHSRFSAKWKRYDYYINDGMYNPVYRNYSTFVKRELNIDKMKEASNIFIGKHDFSSFNATKYEEIVDQVRTIYKIDIIRENSLIKISYFGDGFLRYMVRMITQTLIEVGLNKIEPAKVVEMLEKKDKNACHYNAQPQGLYLVEVGYDPY